MGMTRALNESIDHGRCRRQWEGISWIVIALTLVVDPHFCHAVRIRRAQPKPSTTSKEQQEPNVHKLNSWMWGQEKNVEESAPSQNSTFAQMFYEKYDVAYTAMVDEMVPLRDMWDGFYSAYHVAWTGYYQGFSGLYEYPFEGYTKDGAVGFFTGIAAGMVHFTR
jgi:hypothetical protein